MTPRTALQQLIDSITKPLVCTPSPQKWQIYDGPFRDFFAGRDEGHDKIIAYISEFYTRFNSIPYFASIIQHLQAGNDTDLIAFLQHLANDIDVWLYPEVDKFAAHLKTTQQACFQLDVRSAIDKFERLQQQQGVYTPELVEGLDVLASDLRNAKYRVRPGDAPISLLQLGDQAVKDLQDDYEAIAAQALHGEALYYELPFTNFPDTRIKIHRGDMVFFGAFASQGKSTLLRMATYHFLTYYAVNVVFWTLEMDATEVRMLFAIIHANNTTIYPNAPPITPEAYRDGTLSDEQKDFLFNVALPDFTKNPNYGTLLIEEPQTARFGLADLEQRLGEIESTIVTPHVLALDYITRMYPLPPGGYRAVQTEDYNQLIKDVKRLCLSYRNRKGERAPLICLTAAQVSRSRYEEALGRGGLYDLQAFSLYTEIERSADTAITSFMSPQLRLTNMLQVQAHKHRRGPLPTETLRLYADFRNGGRVMTVETANHKDLADGLRSISL